MWVCLLNVTGRGPASDRPGVCQSLLVASSIDLLFLLTGIWSITIVEGWFSFWSGHMHFSWIPRTAGSKISSLEPGAKRLLAENWNPYDLLGVDSLSILFNLSNTKNRIRFPWVCGGFLERSGSLDGWKAP